MFVVNVESCLFVWYFDIFFFDGIFSVIVVCLKVVFVCFMCGVSVYIFVVVGFDLDVFVIICVWFWVDLIGKFCRKSKKVF